MNDRLGKEAEDKIREWLNKPELGYCFDRIPDQMTGFYGSKNICDFTLFKCPNFYYIESKSTWEDRFDFNQITEHQFSNMLEKSKIENVYAIVIVLFATYQRAVALHIEDIDLLIKSGTKSINIKKIKNWKIPYVELRTIPSRKRFLDYTGNIEDYV